VRRRLPARRTPIVLPHVQLALRSSIADAVANKPDFGSARPKLQSEYALAAFDADTLIAAAPCQSQIAYAAVGNWRAAGCVQQLNSESQTLGSNPRICTLRFCDEPQLDP
jgi:hypothetical protein